MGIYIENEKMPKNCTSCFYAIHCSECVFKDINLKGENVIYYLGLKPKDCPLVEIENEKIKDYTK